MQTIPANIRRKITNSFHKLLKPIYFQSIPLNELFAITLENGYKPIQEDATLWSGLLCGSEGTTLFPLVDSQNTGPVNNSIALQWYKMESGKYEITAYLS